MTEQREMFTTATSDSELVAAWQARPQDDQTREDAIAALREEAEQAAALLANAGDLGGVEI